jgi:hypothetical protein
MSIARRSRLPRIATVLVAGIIAGAALAGVASSQTTDAAAVKQIDTECNAIQDAIMALHPVHVAYQSGTWVVLSDSDVAVAEQTKAALMFADVYKQGSSYAWVHAHSWDANGDQHATQLCFRQGDGTLERARQATTVPALAAASARQAYYASDGTVIQKTAIFEANDPMLAQTIKSLPFYSVLPQ